MDYKKPIIKDAYGWPRDHWALCNDCAKSVGGVTFKSAMTVHEGKCPYCGETKTLIPARDFRWLKVKK